MKTQASEELYHVYPLDKELLTSVQHVLAPIENSRGHLGLLIGAELHDASIERALYIRSGREWRVETFPEVSMMKRKDLYVVQSSGQLLPLPSLHPYTLCEITHQEYAVLWEECGGRPKQMKLGLDRAIAILAQRTRFGVRKKWLQPKTLVTPPGYGDQVSAYLAFFSVNDEDYPVPPARLGHLHHRRL
jgi:hypothetical protein